MDYGCNCLTGRGKAPANDPRNGPNLFHGCLSLSHSPITKSILPRTATIAHHAAGEKVQAKCSVHKRGRANFEPVRDAATLLLCKNRARPSDFPPRNKLARGASRPSVTTIKWWISSFHFRHYVRFRAACFSNGRHNRPLGSLSITWRRIRTLWRISSMSTRYDRSNRRVPIATRNRIHRNRDTDAFSADHARCRCRAGLDRSA